MESFFSWISQDPHYNFMDWLYLSDLDEPHRSPPSVDSMPGNEKISVARTVVFFGVHGLDGDSIAGSRITLSLPDYVKIIAHGFQPEEIDAIVGKCVAIDGIENAAKRLLEKAQEAMCSSTSQRIIFLACGLGGSVVKQALIIAAEDPKYSLILNATGALVFLGTPHRAPLNASRDFTLAKLVHNQLRGSRQGPWIPDGIRNLATRHENLAADFDRIATRFSITSFFQKGSDTGSYDVLIERHAATLDLDKETRIGLQRGHDLLADLDMWEQRRFFENVVEDAYIYTRDEYTTWTNLLSSHTTYMSFHQVSDHRFKRLCDWFLTQHGFGDWICDTTDLRDPSGWQRNDTDPCRGSTHPQPPSFLESSVRVLAVGAAHNFSTVLTSSLMAAIKDKRQNLTDLFINLVQPAGLSRPLTKVQLLAEACQQVILSRPRLVTCILHLSEEAQKALGSHNTAWTETVLWRCLKCLVNNQHSGQVFVIVHEPDKSSLAAPFLDLCNGICNLFLATETACKVLILQKSGDNDDTHCENGRWVINLHDLDAVAAIRRDYEIEVTMTAQKMHSAVCWRINGSNSISHQLQNSSSPTRYLLRFLDRCPLDSFLFSLNSVGHCVIHGGQEAISTLIARVPTSFQAIIRRGLLWVFNAIRPLSLEELEEVLRLDLEKAAGSALQEMPARYFEEFLPEIIEIKGGFLFPKCALLPSCSVTMAGGFKYEDDKRGKIHSAHLEIARFCTNYLLKHMEAPSPTNRSEPYDIVSDNTVSHATPYSPTSLDVGTSVDLISAKFQNAPLLRYAVQHWFVHMQKSGDDSAVDMEPVSTFLDADWRVVLWLQLRNYYESQDSIYWRYPKCPKLGEVKQELNVSTSKAVDLLLRASEVERFSRCISWSAISLAVCQIGDIEVLSEMHRRGYLSDEATLQQMFETGCDEALFQLCQSHSDFVQAHSLDILRNAVRRGSTSLVERLIYQVKYQSEAGVRDDQMPLLLVAASGEFVLPEPILDTQKEYICQTDKMRNARCALHLAAISGNETIVTWIIASCTDMASTINAQDASLATPLLLAARNGHFKIVRRLLDADAAVSMADNEGHTALHEAAASGRYEIVQLLLRKGAPICSTNKKGQTPLHVSLESGHPKIALVLLSHAKAAPTETARDAKQDRNKAEFDVNVRDVDNITPLLLAAERNYPSIVDALLQQGARVDVVGPWGTALHIAAKFGFDDILDLLISNKAALKLVDKEGNSPIHLAARRGQVHIIKKLLRHNSQDNVKNRRGLSALDLACLFGQKAAAMALMSGQAQYELNSAFIQASIAGFVDIAEMLLDEGAYKDATDAEGCTALHFATRHDDTRLLDLLLAPRAKLQARDGKGKTPLHWAAEYKALAAMRKLINAGACLNVRDEFRRSPLCYAAAANYPEMVGMLLKAGAYTESISVTHTSPLHHAFTEFSFDVFRVIAEHEVIGSAREYSFDPIMVLGVLDRESHRREEVVELLIDLKMISGKEKDKAGRTLLHLAAGLNMLDVVTLLIESESYGADLDDVYESHQGTPTQIAAFGGAHEIVRRLLDRDDEIDQGTPTQIAAFKGAHEIVRRLLDKGANATKGCGIHGSPLNAAASGVTRRVGNLDAYLKTVQVILERDNDGNILNHEAGKYGTALQAAASGVVVDMVELLLDHKPKLDILSGQFGTPLHAAVYHRNMEAIDRLMKREKENFSYGTVDHEGRLPFHIAASRGGRLIRWLAASSSDHVLDRDFQGRHTMHFAAASGSYLVCEMILAKYKEALNDTDCDGWTPLHWACRQGELEVIKILIQRRADRNKPSLRMWKPIDVATYFQAMFSLEGFHLVKGWLDQEGQTGAGKDQNEIRYSSNDVDKNEDRSRSQDREHVAKLTSNDKLSEATPPDPEENEEVLPIQNIPKFPYDMPECASCYCIILGPRYHCSMCYEIDLCFKCFRHVLRCHYKGHEFLKYCEGDEQPIVIKPWKLES